MIFENWNLVIRGFDETIKIRLEKFEIGFVECLFLNDV